MQIDDGFFLVSNNCTTGHIYEDYKIKYDHPFNFGAILVKDFVDFILEWDMLIWERVRVEIIAEYKFNSYFGKLHDPNTCFKRNTVSFVIPSKSEKEYRWYFIHHTPEDVPKLKRRFARLQETIKHKRPFFVLVDDTTLSDDRRLTNEVYSKVNEKDNVLVLKEQIQDMYSTRDWCRALIPLLKKRGVITSVL